MKNNIFNLHGHKVILASSSPKRHDILSSLGVEFEVYNPNLDKSKKKGESPTSYALRISQEKARIGLLNFPTHIIIAAETTVAHGKRIIDKALTDDDVRKLLSYLGGKNHIVHTGLSVIFPSNRIVSKISSTKIKMKRFSKEELDFHVASKKGINKAGGYDIQELGETFISSLTGSYSGVSGLPIYQLSQILKGYDGK